MLQTKTMEATTATRTAARAAMLDMGVPRIPGINWRGVWTLYVKEVYRFFKVFLQTVAAPVITTLLFILIFSVALGQLRPDIAGVPLAQFLAPGLIMMSVIQNSFANTSSSLLISKIQGNIVDYLMPPLSPGEINSAMALAGVTRGVLVAIASGICLSFFVDMSLVAPLAVFFHAFGAALMLSLLGIIVGIWSEKFDHLQGIINFVIMPLSFLSGTFYSVRQLPEIAQTVSFYNPFFYMIDGFRYGFTGHAEGDLQIGFWMIVGLNAVLWAICYGLFRSGWRLKT